MKKKTTPKRPAIRKKENTAGSSFASNPFHVVGIGASAGGLEALERFFQNMTESSGMAFIVVSHLDPNHVSIMPELLQKVTRMKLLQAEDGMVIEPNHVYVAPPNRDLSLLHGTIQLLQPLEAHGFRLPIDFFFTSLAADAGEKAICIVLSGMASDGTAGLRAVKSELGMVMVQDPQSAKFDGMPRSAIKTGLADYVLPPEEMPDRLMRYTSQKGKRVLLENANIDGKTSDAFQKIFILVRTHTGQDFSLYKHNTIHRRIERRMNVSQMTTLPSYVRLLQENPAEIENLFQEFLIGVTTFFREPESYESLKKQLLQLVKAKPENGQIRVWVPGCSSGEEAYSIAIILHECMDAMKKNLHVQIFATDIDRRAIEKARIGSFSGIASDVGKERLSRYFTSEGSFFHIRKEIREMLIFAQQSAIKDPPFTKLDLISCRNLLIYFSSDLQKKILPLFQYSLLHDGILFLGSSETVGGFADLFSLVDKKWKIYKRRDSIYSAQPFVEFPTPRSIETAQSTIFKATEVKNITQVAENVILQSCAPNCVIIAENGDIAYIHGRTGKYLEPTHGAAKMNIFQMARGGLQQELPALVKKALSSKKPVSVEGISAKSNSKTELINLTVKPIKEPAEMLGSLLVIFEAAAPVKKASTSKTTRHVKPSGTIIKGLERELKSTKDNLRSTVEELETSIEELKSTNEEMQSTNEEMQSSNEELETSKEELQSLNEELLTINTELEHKNDELLVTNNDMKNLMDSSEIPTIFLDRNLSIKRFTFHATKVVNLIPSDIGRPISHIATNIKYEDLIKDATEVLRTLESKEREVQTRDNLWYQMRIVPYRTINDIIDGVVITFADINSLKIASEKMNALNRDIQVAREYVDDIVETVRESLLILDKDLRVLSANRSFYKMFDTVSEQTVGKFIYELQDKKWDLPQLRTLLEQIIPQRSFFEDYEVQYDSVGAGRKRLVLNARQIFHGGTETKLILLAIQSQNVKEGGD